MAFSYTKDSLKAALQDWNESDDSEFVARLDEIIQRGELLLARDLDLETADTVATANTASGVATITKPSNLISDRLLTVSVSGQVFTLSKRSRAFVALYNATGTQGQPKHYAESSETAWTIAPVPNAILTVSVHGTYVPASIIDGGGTGTTWLSTRFPDLLYLACQIEAAEYLKFWGHKASAELQYAARLDNAIAQVKNLKRADIEDIYHMRGHSNQPTVPPEPEAT